MILRTHALNLLEQTLAENPICALLGPRQCGKTTLARDLYEQSVNLGKEAHWYDLESQQDLASLSQPEMALKGLKGLVVMDEVQRKPELFAALRPLADRKNLPTRFLLLGSASPEIIKGVSESLSGRVGFVDLGGFTLNEIGSKNWETLWQRGGFPKAYLAESDEASSRWRANFIRTFLEQDIPQLGILTPAETLRRFWTMMAHYHGQIWNAAELARSLGTSEPTVRRYLDLLCGTYMIRKLQPWHTNMGKREIKAPKVYLRDPGLLHGLLGIRTRQELLSHPKLGASWEGFGIEQILEVTGQRDTWFWGTHNGAELDLLLHRGGKAYGFEFKMTDHPTVTKSLKISLADLNLEQAWIIHPGERRFPLGEKIEALPLTQIASLAFLKN